LKNKHPWKKIGETLALFKKNEVEEFQKLLIKLRDQFNIGPMKSEMKLLKNTVMIEGMCKAVTAAEREKKEGPWNDFIIMIIKVSVGSYGPIYSSNMSR
jgi:hypothetical protein